MKPPRVDFFFDVISPYSWIGFEAITRYNVVWGIDLCYKPFSFAGVVKNNPGAPLKNDSKKWYLFEDAPRAAKYWNFEIKFPKNYEEIIFTKSPAPAMRLVNAFLDQRPELLVPVSRALWRRLYVEGKGFFDDSELIETMKEMKIEDPESFLEHSKSEKVRNMLREHTKEALEGRAFGAPWFHVHTGQGVQHFFGADSLPLIAHCLQLPYSGSLQ